MAGKFKTNGERMLSRQEAGANWRYVSGWPGWAPEKDDKDSMAYLPGPVKTHTSDRHLPPLICKNYQGYRIIWKPTDGFQTADGPGVMRHISIDNPRSDDFRRDILEAAKTDLAVASFVREFGKQMGISQ